MSGSVKYAGEFKKYGKMIILEHPSGYHSLVAGLETINTAVGQEIDVGEPIGVMPSTGSKRPILYYELRYNGSPVNPARKFGKLS
jgi:septal ring factor EnvC (AmiA/AmiB activator)